MSDQVLSTLSAAAILGALILYALLGGADYGGGLWDLVARGPRAAKQRALIERSIAPVWEANHVWLIVAVVLLFVGFPACYAVISVALHVPLTLLLLGIVLRGTSFTFRHYDHSSDTAQARWGRLFAWASVFTPIMLGITLGAMTAGTIRLRGRGDEAEVTSGLFDSWLAPFPIAVGLFALSLFAFLAAVYLTVETGDDKELAEDFRRRGIVAGVAVGIFALAAASLIPRDAPFASSFLGSAWSWPIQIMTGVSAITSFIALFTRHYRVARFAAISQVSLILLGWGAAQYPYLIAPGMKLEDAAAPRATLSWLLAALGAGLPILGPTLYWLLRVFKREPAFTEMDEDESEEGGGE